MKKAISLLLITILCLSVFPVSSLAASKQLDGSAITWSYDSAAGKLTVAGSGDMPEAEYSFEENPWYRYRTKIKTVVIEKGVTSVRAYAFRGMSALKSVTIPSSVRKVGECAFGETALGTVSSNKSYGALYAGKWLVSLLDCAGSLKIRSGTVGVADGLTANGVTSLSLPSSVKHIGKNSFTQLYLKEITVDAANTAFTSDAKGVLYNKGKTELIAYPAGRTAASFSVPSGVKSISGCAFIGCEALETLSLPASLKSFPAESVGNCPNLKKITVGTSNKYLTAGTDGVLYNKDKTELVCYPRAKTAASYSVPKSVTSIAAYAFDGAAELQKITLPSKLKSIGDSAFARCSALQSVSLPSGLTSLGEKAFNACYSMSSVQLSSALTEIAPGAFMNTGIKTLLLPNGIKTIGAEAFAYSSVSSVILPDTVESIGDKAFINCYSLKKINLPDGLLSVGGSAFAFDSLLKIEKLPDSLTEIGENAFAYCSSLACAALPEKLEKLGARAFQGAPVSALTIPAGVTKLPEAAFTEGKFTTVKVPYTVKEIGEYALGSTQTLKSLYVFNKSCKLPSSLSLYPMKGMKIYGYRGSTAETFAKKNGLTFSALDGNHTHTNVTTVTPATMQKAGGKVTVCKYCGNKTTKKIAAVKSASLEKTSYVYNGQGKLPAVTVKDTAGKTLVKGTDYTVKYSSNKAVGKASVIITFKGNYAGTKTLTFKINPAAPSSLKLTSPQKGKITLSWAKGAGAGSYEIYRATSKNGTYSEIKTTTSSSFTDTSRVSGKTYYYKVRACKTVSGTVYRSDWCAIKYLKAK